MEHEILSGPHCTLGLLHFMLKNSSNELREYSGAFEDVLSNAVICFLGIPSEFRGKMTVLLEISDKDPLYSHCY